MQQAGINGLKQVASQVLCCFPWHPSVCPRECRGLLPALIIAVPFASVLWPEKPEKISFSMVCVCVGGATF